jgi:hypothetical protein
MTFIWPESARAELRAIERETAIRILRALDRYGDSGEGDVRALTGQWQGYFRILSLSFSRATGPSTATLMSDS